MGARRHARLHPLTEPLTTNDDAVADAERARVAVWDLPVRVVHWWIVALLVALIVTGKLGADWLEWHMRIGQAMLALVVFRILWGFVGSRNARFTSFLYRPVDVARYARSAFRSYEPHATHNPLGGWMVVLLLGALLVQAVTGLFTNDDILWGGPLSEKVTKATSDSVSAIHRQFWWVIVVLSALHIGAVLTYLALLKENLIVPMLTGHKHLPEGVADPADASASTAKAILLLVACGLAVWYLLNRL
jgi:cytochrome b